MTILQTITAPDGYEQLDTTEVMGDKSLSIHALALYEVKRSELCATVQVFDLSQVRVSTTAKSAIKAAFITPLLLVKDFALHYQKHVIREVNRGKGKERLILDPEASRFVYSLSSGGRFTVQAETIDFGGEHKRRLTIEFDEQDVVDTPK